jgi:hypothetical protein
MTLYIAQCAAKASLQRENRNGNQEESKEGREEEKEVSEPKAKRNGGGESLPQNFLRDNTVNVAAGALRASASSRTSTGVTLLCLWSKAVGL